LEGLWLDSNKIDDVSPLANLINLRELWLVNNNIDDISPLMSLTNLEYLYLWQNPITQEQVSELQEALPLVTIEWDGNSTSELSLAATGFNNNIGWSRYLLSHENIREYFDTPEQLSEFLGLSEIAGSPDTNEEQSDSLLELRHIPELSGSSEFTVPNSGLGWSVGTLVYFQFSNGIVTSLSAYQSSSSSGLVSASRLGFDRRLPRYPDVYRSGLISYYRIEFLHLRLLVEQRAFVYGNGDYWYFSILNFFGNPLGTTWG